MDKRLSTQQSENKADGVARNGAVEIGPRHVGNHDQLRKDNDKDQIRTQLEEPIDRWDSESQGNGDSAGADHRHFHAISQLFLRSVWSENDLVDVSHEHGRCAKDG